MKIKRTRTATTLPKALALALLVSLSVVVPAAHGQAENDVWVSVDKVLVNRMGGVSVSGQVDCSAMAQTVREGEFFYLEEGEFGEEWLRLVVSENTVEDQYFLNMLANSDNYTVTQPAGRRATISVTHGSSRMSPCLIEKEIPNYDASRCAAGGSPCRWESDHFGYDRDGLGPFFDYSPNGKFKAGLLNVAEESIGLDVAVVHVHDGQVVGVKHYYAPEGSYAYTNVSIRAVSYRG